MAATLVVDIEVVRVSPSLTERVDGLIVYVEVLEVSVIVISEVIPTCVVRFELENSFILRFSFPSVARSLARVCEKLNVLDVIIMVNMILGDAEVNLNTGDMNGDGLINVSDVVLLINNILG